MLRLVTVSVVAFAAVLLASCDRERIIGEPAPWVCAGTVAADDGGQALAGVRFSVDGNQQGTSDSSGGYYAILGFARGDADSLLFSLEGYRDAVALLDTARVIASHHLAMDIRMTGLKDGR